MPGTARGAAMRVACARCAPTCSSLPTVARAILDPPWLRRRLFIRSVAARPDVGGRGPRSRDALRLDGRRVGGGPRRSDTPQTYVRARVDVKGKTTRCWARPGW